MGKIIRWPGLIAFFVISALIAAFFYFFAAYLLRIGIEAAGTQMVGARVDVGDVKLQWQPAEVRLLHVAVTDVDAPMQNLLEFDEARANIDLLKLAMGQVIISNLDLNGLRFQTRRKTSGSISKAESIDEDATGGKEASAVEQQLDELAAALPDTDDILAREPLLIDERKGAWDALSQEKQQAWAEIQGRLPSKEKIAGYQQRWDEIRKGKIQSVEDFQQRKAKLDALKADIRADKQTLAEAKAFLRSSKEELQQSLNALKAAPKEDWQRIKEKYTLDEQGVVNLSGLLFGDQVGQYTDKGLYWYKKLKPLMVDTKTEEEKTRQPQRQKGRFIRFPEANPMPDVLIKEAHISVVFEQGEVDMLVRDITHQQHIINRPTRLDVTGAELRDIKTLELSAVFDHRHNSSKNTADLHVGGVSIKAFKLSGGQHLPISLAQADADFTGKLALIDGEFSGNLHGDFSDAAFTATATSGLAKEIALALQQVHAFTLDAALKGDLQDLDVSLRSDIDKRMQAAFNQRLEEKKQAFRENMQAKLQQRLQQYLGDSSADVFSGEADIDGNMAQLDVLLDAKLDDFKEQKQQELEDKLKDKLKKLF